jgi:hypothetical protein
MWEILSGLGAIGVTAAGIRYAWRLAAGEDARHQRNIWRDVEIARAQHPHAPHHYAPHISLSDHRRLDVRGNGDPRLPGTPGDHQPTGAQADAAPTFADLLQSGNIGLGQPIALGHDGRQLVTATWMQLYSSAIGGLSGTGKTWAAASLIAQSVINGAGVAIIDPDAPDPQSLSSRLAPLSARWISDPAEDDQQIAHMCAHLASEMERRRQGQAERRPLVVAIDEYAALVQAPGGGDLAALVEEIARRGRKLGVFALALSQLWQGARTGGSATRDSFASSFVMRMRPNQARMLTGLRSAELPGDLHELAPGVAYLIDTRGNMQRITTPHCTQSDLHAVAGLLTDTAPTIDTSPQPQRSHAATATETTATAPARANRTPEEERIISMFFEEEKSIGQIVEAIVGKKLSGAAYQKKAETIQEALRKR